MKTEQFSTEPQLGQERNKEIKDSPEFNKNESTTYPNFWNTMKAVIREKFIDVGFPSVCCDYHYE